MFALDEDELTLSIEELYCEGELESIEYPAHMRGSIRASKEDMLSFLINRVHSSPPVWTMDSCCYRHNTWKNIADIDQTMPFEFCGLNMTWFGASFNGSSVMCYLPEAVDMALHVAGNAVYDENGKLVNSRQGDLPGKRYSSLTPIWRASRGKLRYTRRMSVKLTENGYVGMAQALPRACEGIGQICFP